MEYMPFPGLHYHFLYPSDLNCNRKHNHHNPSNRKLSQALKPLNFPQTYRRRDPPETHQAARLLPHPRSRARHMQAGNRSFQRFDPLVILFPLVDTCHRVGHVPFVFILHRDGILPLPLAGRSDLSQDAATEDFDLGQVVIGVSGVAPHRLFEVLFVPIEGMPLSKGTLPDEL